MYRRPSEKVIPLAFLNTQPSWPSGSGGPLNDERPAGATGRGTGGDGRDGGASAAAPRRENAAAFSATADFGFGAAGAAGATVAAGGAAGAGYAAGAAGAGYVGVGDGAAGGRAAGGGGVVDASG